MRKGIQNRMLCDKKVRTGFINTEEVVPTGFSRTTQISDLWSHSNTSNILWRFLWCLFICYIWQNAWIEHQILQALCKLDNNYLMWANSLNFMWNNSSFWHQQCSHSVPCTNISTKSSDPCDLKWLNRPPASSSSEISEDYARTELSRMHMAYIYAIQIQRSSCLLKSKKLCQS